MEEDGGSLDFRVSLAFLSRHLLEIERGGSKMQVKPTRANLEQMLATTRWEDAICFETIAAEELPGVFFLPLAAEQSADGG